MRNIKKKKFKPLIISGLIYAGSILLLLKESYTQIKKRDEKLKKEGYKIKDTYIDYLKSRRKSIAGGTIIFLTPILNTAAAIIMVSADKEAVIEEQIRDLEERDMLIPIDDTNKNENNEDAPTLKYTPNQKNQ